MMITFSISRFSLLLISPSPSGGLGRYFTLYSSSCVLHRPLLDGLPQLHESPDPKRNREPERDQAEDQDRREDRLGRDPEQHERADQPGVDRTHAGGGRRCQVGDHAEEVPLYDDAKRDADVERVEARPEDADVAGPPAERAD